ncbi:hypothetical protein FRC12_013457 [Ceratobasidium sp. 428]|nr:hypothetical protein FRC12_013457 [Ceratobasidium sp. 428]
MVVALALGQSAMRTVMVSLVVRSFRTRIPTPGAIRAARPPVPVIAAARTVCGASTPWGPGPVAVVVTRIAVSAGGLGAAPILSAAWVFLGLFPRTVWLRNV